MFGQSIEPKTKRVLEKIAKTWIAKDFYLAGGTALTVWLGHRESIDLDWFCREGFSDRKIKEELAKIGEFKLSGEDKGTIHGELDGVKVTFLHYGYKQLFPAAVFEGINLADERDIAAMKIDAVSSRGSKKDFVDLYFLLEKYSLDELLGFFEKKFSGVEYNRLHILKSLVYFENADNDPMPTMLKKIDWDEIKKAIAKKALDF